MSFNQAILGYGTTLGVDIANGSTYVVLAGLINPPNGPSAKTEKVDVSLLSSKSKSFAGGQIDPGELTLDIAYDPADTNTTGILATLFTNSNVASWQITYSNAETEVFHGFVGGFDRKMTSTTRVSATVNIILTSADPF